MSNIGLLGRDEKISGVPSAALGAGRDIAIEKLGAYPPTGAGPRVADRHVIIVCSGHIDHLAPRPAVAAADEPLLIGGSTIIPAGVFFRWRCAFPAHLCITVAPAALARVVGYAAGPAPRALRVRDALIEQIASVCDTELRRRSRHPAQDIVLDLMAAALLAHLARVMGGPDRDPGAGGQAMTSAPVRRALDYINARPTEAHPLERLAQAAGISRSHFARQFSAQVGISPVRYSEKVRIAYAKDLLRAGSVHIAAVATAVGFSDQSHFARRFRQEVGCTPSAYARWLGD
ncbi:helix-turn-helix transcriptional regulator [Dactylosporangium sp. CA-092794]|uniref:helix-turn-helix transcriptional regulator n=1 Tax=Dactylosporangium sp. CA-092794 TaxID=3239929 RepID=UPI003D8DE243